MSFLAYIFPLASKWLVKSRTTAADTADNVEVESVEETSGIIDELSGSFPSVISEEHNHVIIAGPDTANKTSFAFQAAVTAATNGCKVVHICTHPISKLPAPVHGMSSPEPSVMKNVDLLYIEETPELIAYFAGIHMKKKLPSYIIVEDILSYASQRQDKSVERTLAKLLALISNTRSWTANHNETGKCSVLLTAPSRIKSIQNVLRQFDYEVASYEGPTKDDVNSKISFTCNTAQISISFQRQNKCLILNDVCVTSRESADRPNEGNGAG